MTLDIHPPENKLYVLTTVAVNTLVLRQNCPNYENGSDAQAPLLAQEGRRERMFLFASGGVVAHTPSVGMRPGRMGVSDHPVRSFQSRTPLLYQEGNFARRFNNRTGS